MVSTIHVLTSRWCSKNLRQLELIRGPHEKYRPLVPSDRDNLLYIVRSSVQLVGIDYVQAAHT